MSHDRNSAHCFSRLWLLKVQLETSASQWTCSTFETREEAFSSTKSVIIPFGSAVNSSYSKIASWKKQFVDPPSGWWKLLILSHWQQRIWRLVSLSSATMRLYSIFKNRWNCSFSVASFRPGYLISHFLLQFWVIHTKCISMSTKLSSITLLGLDIFCHLMDIVRPSSQCAGDHAGGIVRREGVWSIEDSSSRLMT